MQKWISSPWNNDRRPTVAPEPARIPRKWSHYCACSTRALEFLFSESSLFSVTPRSVKAPATHAPARRFGGFAFLEVFSLKHQALEATLRNSPSPSCCSLHFIPSVRPGHSALLATASSSAMWTKATASTRTSLPLLC